MKIKVKFHVESWAGIENKFPPPKEIELILSKGDIVGRKEFGDFPGSGLVKIPRIEIIGVDEKGISVSTNGLVEPNPGGGINLNVPSEGLTHNISLGKTLILNTQSMDTGMKISITPVEIVIE